MRLSNESKDVASETTFAAPGKEQTNAHVTNHTSQHPDGRSCRIGATGSYPTIAVSAVHGSLEDRSEVRNIEGAVTVPFQTFVPPPVLGRNAGRKHDMITLAFAPFDEIRVKQRDVADRIAITKFR